MQDMLKKILLDNINNDEIYNISHLLKSYNQPQSYFNKTAYFDLLIFLMYKYHIYKRISSLVAGNMKEIFEMLDSIPIEISFDDFKTKISELFEVQISKTRKLGHYVVKNFCYQTGEFGTLFGPDYWLRIFADRIEGIKTNDITHRIYLSIDNQYLHEFAYLLVMQCDSYNIPYYFKINNEDGENAYDNVVIYANEKELAFYLKSIHEILMQQPKIKTNQQCLIAYPCDHIISVAPYLDNDFQSYSSIVSDNISHFRAIAQTREEFILMVEQYLNTILDPIKIFCDRIKNNNSFETYDDNKKYM